MKKGGSAALCICGFVCAGFRPPAAPRRIRGEPETPERLRSFEISRNNPAFLSRTAR
jgi:hypothetical protein